MSGQGPRSSKDPMQPQWIEIGITGKAHGLKGEIYIWPYEDGSSLLTATTLLLKKGNVRFIKRIEKVRQTPKAFLVQLEGIEDRDAARRITGFQVFVDRNEFPELDEDEFYYTDLEGASVFNVNGELLGEVDHLEWHGADFIYFYWQQKLVAIPLIDDLVEEFSTDPARIVLKIEDPTPYLIEV